MIIKNEGRKWLYHITLNELVFVMLPIQYKSAKSREMGAANPKPQQTTPTPIFGGRIIEILNPDLLQKMQPFTDYIISPSMQVIKQSKEQIEVTIFSSLDYSTRKETLPIHDQHFGIKIKQCKIRDCILRITKIFANSPCEKLGVAYDQYIVGLVDAEYEDLKGFADSLRGLIGKRKEEITMAVCNQNGKARLVSIPLQLLDEWKLTNKGILGCQLAEGWMNRFKSRPKKPEDPLVVQVQAQSSISQIQQPPKLTEQRIRQQIQSNMNEIKKNQEQTLGEFDQIQRKCQQLLNIKGGTIQKTFKGLLKSQYLDDASTICKCKNYNKNCEKCYTQKQNIFYFFNKKTNRIISIPGNLLFSPME